MSYSLPGNVVYGDRSLPIRAQSSKRYRMHGALAAVAVLAMGSAISAPATSRAEVLTSPALNLYGMPGGLDTPSAEVLQDGSLAAYISRSKMARKQGLSFQFSEKGLATLRYGRAEGYDLNRGYLWDRSFDLRYQLLGEEGWRPAVAIGLQDFIGTGVYSAEYVVATKTLTPRLRASVGLGWGRLASRGSIGTPFGSRPDLDFGKGGKLSPKQWFRGPVAPFASLSWQPAANWRLTAEYSGDDYGIDIAEARKVGKDWDDLSTRINLGVQYVAHEGYQLGAYVLGGKVIGAQASLVLAPSKAPYPSGLEPAPAPVRPRPAPAADPEGWSGVWASDPTAQPAIQTALAKALDGEGQMLESMALSANRAEVRIRNQRYTAQAEAIGRTARMMTRALPPSVEVFVITLSEDGLPVSSTTLRRSDIEAHENTASAHIASLTQIDNADPAAQGLVATPGLFPKLTWNLGPYLTTSSFDPAQPLRHEVGAEASARYEVLPGLVFAGTIRQRAFGNYNQRAPGRRDAPGGYGVDEYDALSDATLQAQNLGVPRVRSDTQMYAGQSSPTIPELTVNWYAQPAAQIYTRVTAGLLETAFGGVSAEALWYPSDSRLAIGAELNHIRKRDFEKLFAFRDYKTTTGHVSAYYDFGGGYTGKLHAGRYLAEDWGATVELQRRFANGWVVGAYATKTDMSEEKFGEGSFDKGITLSLPISWAIGTPGRKAMDADLRSLSRDGGARLSVRGRLYETVRPAQTGDIYEGWGRFWR